MPGALQVTRTTGPVRPASRMSRATQCSLQAMPFLWRAVKYEAVYLDDYGDVGDATDGISQYCTFDNNQRPHQALRYLTPAAVHFTSGGECTVH